MKLKKHYCRYLFGIPVYYLLFECWDEKYVTLNKLEYDKIVKQKYYIFE